MSLPIDIGDLDDFPLGAFRLVKIGPREIGILRTGHDVFAIRNRCPHQSGPVCRGSVSARLDGPQVGQIVADENRAVVACPWHGWEFDIRSGHSLTDPHLRLKTYPVNITPGNRILLQVERVRSGEAQPLASADWTTETA
jgi:nitrite reductase/ring-hydroxylating ferredoxin subunit